MPRSRSRDPGVGDDEGDAEGFFVVRPLPGETAVSHVITVVGGVDDDGVFGEPGFFECFYKTADGEIDAADHSIVGANIDVVFFFGVPTPEVALAVEGSF